MVSRQRGSHAPNCGFEKNNPEKFNCSKNIFLTLPSLGMLPPSSNEPARCIQKQIQIPDSED